MVTILPCDADTTVPRYADTRVARKLAMMLLCALSPPCSPVQLFPDLQRVVRDAPSDAGAGPHERGNRRKTHLKADTGLIRRTRFGTSGWQAARWKPYRERCSGMARIPLPAPKQRGRAGLSTLAHTQGRKKRASMPRASVHNHCPQGPILCPTMPVRHLPVVYGPAGPARGSLIAPNMSEPRRLAGERNARAPDCRVRGRPPRNWNRRPANPRIGVLPA